MGAHNHPLGLAGTMSRVCERRAAARSMAGAGLGEIGKIAESAKFRTALTPRIEAHGTRLCLVSQFAITALAPQTQAHVTRRSPRSWRAM